MTYNERIEELNKEENELTERVKYCEECKKAEILGCQKHLLDNENLQARKEQLEELRNEAIAKVKELIERKENLADEISDEEAEAVIDFLIDYWNITNEDS